MSWGAFGPGGFAAVVPDMARVASAPERCTRALLLFAHGVGSFAAQRYLLDQIASSAAWSYRAPRTLTCVLSTAHQARPARRQCAYPAPATPFDPLGCDEREADAYIADALCGFTIMPASRLPMLEACDRLPTADAFSAMPNEALPIHLFVGDQDPINHHLARRGSRANCPVRRVAAKLPALSGSLCLGLSDTCPAHATDARMPPS